MSTSVLKTNSSQAADHNQPEHSNRAQVDSSLRSPLLFFYATAILWLLVATFLGFAASVKLHRPEFLASCPLTTYGRMWPAFLNALTYGWASLAGLATALWLLARMCRVPLKNSGILTLGGVIWNLGVAYGVGAILMGNSTGHLWLEIPRSASFLLLVGYSLIAVWGLVMFRSRREGYVYISVWYLVGALLWFPWAYLSALVFMPNIAGVMQAVVEANFAQNLFGLWFGALGLGIIYYLIPKVLGRPVYSHSLASIGFWSYAFLFAWTGAIRLVGGPLPAWQITISIAASILLLIPIACVTCNYLLTLKGNFHQVNHSPTIRFSIFAAIAWTLSGVAMVFTSLRSVSKVVHFTVMHSAQTHLVLYAFFSMVIFGAMYYIVPRLTGCEWLSASFIRIHFWGSAYGIGMITVMLVVGGIVQGFALDNPTVSSVAVVERTIPFLVAQSLGWLLLTASHFVLAFHFLLMLLRRGRPGGLPTLFAPLKEVQS